MPSLPSRLIFPSWCLQNIKTKDVYSTSITESRGGEVTDSNWSESRFIITLSNAQIPDFLHREIKAVNRILKGRAKYCWFRRYGDDEWELNGPHGTGELLGLGNGVQTVFQARVYDEVQGKGGSLPVYGLDHDIPVIGQDVNRQSATQTRYVEVFVNGVPQVLGTHYTVIREGGKIVFTTPPANGAVIKLRGGFFALVRLTDEGIETEPMSAQWYRISNEVALIQPKNTIQLLGGG